MPVTDDTVRTRDQPARPDPPTPYLLLPGTAREALISYAEIFGGTVELHSFAEFGRSDGPPDAIAHGMLVDSPVALYAADAAEGESSFHATGLMLSLLGTAAAATLRGWFAGLAEEGTVVDDLRERPWGAFDGRVIDRQGVPWLIGFEGEGGDRAGGDPTPRLGRGCTSTRARRPGRSGHHEQRRKSCSKEVTGSGGRCRSFRRAGRRLPAGPRTISMPRARDRAITWSSSEGTAGSGRVHRARCDLRRRSISRSSGPVRCLILSLLPGRIDDGSEGRRPPARPIDRRKRCPQWRPTASRPSDSRAGTTNATTPWASWSGGWSATGR